MKLELKHLAAYLPYGLKINAIKNAEHNNTFELVGLSAGSSCFSIECRSINSGYEHEFISYNEDIKPILKPLSDLDKPILMKGKKIIPYHFVPAKFKMPVKEVSIYPILELPWIVLNLFFEMHFDVFGLIDKGLAIDINTLKP